MKGTLVQMKSIINKFSSNQIMSEKSIEFFHYQDIRFGKVHPHSHSHYEFYFFLDGTTKYVIDNQEFNLEKGDFLIIPPNLLHFPEVSLSNSNRPYERFVIWVEPTYYDSIGSRDASLNYMWEEISPKKSWHIRPEIEKFQSILEILTMMMDESVKQDLSYKIAIESLFIQLLVLINRVIQNKASFQKHNPTKDLYSRIINYIHSHVKEKITLTHLTNEFYVSQSYISKIFVQHLGMSVHQYILRLKLNHILYEVAQGRPVSVVSYEYGFNNYSSFYRQCKKEFGVSPRELKNQ
jgi:AraC-like DNA-binding protein